MAITLDEANTMLAAAVAKGKEAGARLSIVIVDVGGGILAVNRMDGASLSSYFGAHGKARASAIFSRPSAMLVQAADNPTMRNIMASAGEIVPGQGGVPIYRNGILEGAIAGGGGSGDQDEDAAKAGVEAVKLSITR